MFLAKCSFMFLKATRQRYIRVVNSVTLGSHNVKDTPGNTKAFKSLFTSWFGKLCLFFSLVFSITNKHCKAGFCIC